eukprot:6483577-Prymnesium_polylepis.1
MAAHDLCRFVCYRSLGSAAAVRGARTVHETPGEECMKNCAEPAAVVFAKRLSSATPWRVRLRVAH